MQCSKWLTRGTTLCPGLAKRETEIVKQGKQCLIKMNFEMTWTLNYWLFTNDQQKVGWQRKRKCSNTLTPKVQQHPNTPVPNFLHFNYHNLVWKACYENRLSREHVFGWNTSIVRSLEVWHFLDSTGALSSEKASGRGASRGAGGGKYPGRVSLQRRWFRTAPPLLCARSRLEARLVLDRLPPQYANY